MWTWEETHRISSSPICLFTWLCWVLVGAHWIFRLCCGMWNLSMRHADSQLLQVGSSSHPGVKFRPPVFGGMAAQPLDQQGSPQSQVLMAPQGSPGHSSQPAPLPASKCACWSVPLPGQVPKTWATSSRSSFGFPPTAGGPQSDGAPGWETPELLSHSVKGAVLHGNR